MPVTGKRASGDGHLAHDPCRPAAIEVEPQPVQQRRPAQRVPDMEQPPDQAVTRSSGCRWSSAQPHTAGPVSSAARSRPSCPLSSLQTAPPGPARPREARAALPPSRQRRRHAYAELHETRSRRATSGGSTPSVNDSAACNRTFSRLGRPAADRPPPSRISYGTGGNVQSFGYDGLHQLTSDTVATSGGAQVASIGYGYNSNNDVTSMTTSGLASPGRRFWDDHQQL